ncbi:MAG: ATP cone domain-containing protein, partial [Alcanivoracaceae bacterium]|nr:ATP cone domain-containing protein [Alcanivoracaceae bacterium]
MHTETHSQAGSAPQAGSSAIEDSSLNATAPGQLRVIKRNGKVVPYTNDKIIVAITKAFLAVEGGNAAASSRIHDTVERLADQVTAIFKRRLVSGGTFHIEEIQDQVELALMRAGEHKVARSYVLYREEQSRKRAAESAALPTASREVNVNVTMEDGSLQPLDMARLEHLIREACLGLADVDADKIIDETIKNLYDGVSLSDVNTSMVMTARTMIELEPNYSQVTARLLMDSLRAEALQFLGVAKLADQQEMEALYGQA